MRGSSNTARPPAETQTNGDSYEFIQIKTPLSLSHVCAGGRVIPPPSPTGASNLQPVLHHAGVVSAQNWMTGEPCVAVSPISWQRDLNLERGGGGEGGDRREK